MSECARLYVDETTAPTLEPKRGKRKTGDLWAIRRADRGCNGVVPRGDRYRSGQYAAEILDSFNGTIQIDAYGGYSHLATRKRKGR